HAFPLLKRRILDRFGFLPLLGGLRPAHFGSLIARVSYCVIRTCEERAFLLGEAEDVILNPIFQTEGQRPGLDCFGSERFFGFEKSRTTVLENLGQPVNDPLLDFEDRASPEIKLLPVDVLIANFVEPLPRYPTGLLIGALAGGPLKAGGRVAHGLPFGFLHTGVPGMGTQGWVSSIVASETAACRPILVDFVITGSHFSWALLRHLPLSSLRKQPKSATHFQIEK